MEKGKLSFPMFAVAGSALGRGAAIGMTYADSYITPGATQLKKFSTWATPIIGGVLAFGLPFIKKGDKLASWKVIGITAGATMLSTLVDTLYNYFIAPAPVVGVRSSVPAIRVIPNIIPSSRPSMGSYESID